MSSECASQQEHYYPAEATCYIHTSSPNKSPKRSGSKNVPPEEEKQHLGNVFTRARGRLPSYSPHHTCSYTFLDLADDAQQWPGALAYQNSPCISGLTYHPGHCDDCSFFSPKCSESCDWGWPASAWQWEFVELVQIELHQVSSKDGSLTGGKKRFLNSEHGIKKSLWNFLG